MKQRKTGTVVAIIDRDTLKVVVARSLVHPLYRKRRTVTKRYLVDAREPHPLVGARATIEAIPKVSRRKSWRLVSEEEK